MYRVKPTKPVAILSAFVGAGMLIFVWTSVSKSGSPPAFLAFFSVIVVAIVGINLWSAFSAQGGTENVVQAAPIEVQEEPSPAPPQAPPPAPQEPSPPPATPPKNPPTVE